MANLTTAGAQGDVSSTVTLTATALTSGEIAVFTTANVSNQFAVITYNFLAAISGGGASLNGCVGLPGLGQPGPGSPGNTMNGANIFSGGAGFEPGIDLGTAVTSQGNHAQVFPSGIMMFYKGTSSQLNFGAGGKLILGPNTAFKLPYYFYNTNGGNATLTYNIDYHVLYGIY